MAHAARQKYEARFEKGCVSKTPLTDVRGSVDSVRYRAATVTERFAQACYLSGRRQKSTSIPVAERLRAARKCSRSAFCRCATFETAPCDGSACPACARKRLRPPARVVT